jgi:hypothetical protein
MPSQETLIEIVSQSPLSATTRDFFTQKIKREGATKENIIALRELLRAVQTQKATAAGVNLENNPKIQAASEQMASDLKAAGDRYAATMKRLEAEADRLTADIQKDLQHLEQIVVKSAQAEA